MKKIPLEKWKSGIMFFRSSLGSYTKLNQTRWMEKNVKPINRGLTLVNGTLLMNQGVNGA